VTVVKGAEFVGERLKYILLSGRRRDIIFMNGHAQTEVKGDDSKDSFCEEFEQAFDHLTHRLLMSYIYGAPSKARNANVVYIWT